jgi:peptidoglycan/xylan/chitin deacetylase (PgdA/CDA1 family)
MYHDIIDSNALEGSGFSGVSSSRYTMERVEFEAHMAALSKHMNGGPSLAPDLLQAWPGNPSVMLTFDDGGLSAYTTVMNVLERYGWKAHFFIPTDFIGQAHFLKPMQIRALRARGHVIGSHSCSHPSMMSWKDQDSVRKEWADSRNCLSDILGEEVETASLPGGYYSRAIAEAASCVGIRALFTSEPTRRSHMVGTCRVFGRSVILAGTAHDREVQLLRGSYLLRSKEHVVWTLKKAGKTFGGKAYLKLRAMALRRGLF